MPSRGTYNVPRPEGLIGAARTGHANRGPTGPWERNYAEPGTGFWL
jgi:hypothetical protein